MEGQSLWWYKIEYYAYETGRSKYEVMAESSWGSQDSSRVVTRMEEDLYQKLFKVSQIY